MYDATEGISINVTLIFSLARYAVVQVLEDQGVSTFEASWYHLCQRLAAVLRRG